MLVFLEAVGRYNFRGDLLGDSLPVSIACAVESHAPTLSAATHKKPHTTPQRISDAGVEECDVADICIYNTLK